MTRSIAFALGLLALSGCAEFTLTDLRPLEDAVVGVDEIHSLARVVRVDADPVQTSEIGLAEGEISLAERPGPLNQVALFTHGTLGDADDPPVPSEVVLVDRSGELGRWTLGRQYARASFSASGRYLLATEPWGRLVVENDVEVVDLDGSSMDPPTALSLRSLGGEVPTAAAFSDPIAWTDGAPLRVAALFAAGQLSLFDLDAPGAPPVTIPTTVDGAALGPAPVEARFVGSEIVVRTSGGAQLLVVSLTESLVAARRFDVTLRTLATRAPVTALAIDERATTPRVVALTRTHLHVFELATSLESTVELPAAYERILTFEGPAPGDPSVRPRLALWGSAPSLTFVDLGDRASDVLDASTLALAFSPDDVVADPGAARLVAFVRRGFGAAFDVSGSGGRIPASVIDLSDRSTVALATTGDVTRAVISDDLSDVWIASEDGYVNRFDVDTRGQEELWLEDDVESLMPLAGGAQRVLAFHDVAAGTFSILGPGVTEPREVDSVF